MASVAPRKPWLYQVASIGNSQTRSYEPSRKLSHFGTRFRNKLFTTIFPRSCLSQKQSGTLSSWYTFANEYVWIGGFSCLIKMCRPLRYLLLHIPIIPRRMAHLTPILL